MQILLIIISRPRYIKTFEYMVLILDDVKGAVKDNQASLCFYDICKACEYFDCASCGCGALFESRRDEFAEQSLIGAREKSANAARQKNISRTDVPIH